MPLWWHMCAKDDIGVKICGGTWSDFWNLGRRMKARVDCSGD